MDKKVVPVKKLRNKTASLPTMDGAPVSMDELYKLSRNELLELKKETSDVVYYVKYNGQLNMCRLIKSHFHLCNPTEGYINPVPLCTVNKSDATYVRQVNEDGSPLNSPKKVKWWRVLKAFFTDLINILKKK